ncbi:probable cyclic nucleotide-gated ion channel 20, chloroplastic [Rutidosis leptorrhynchoides]|uniref:probable cyclic nucleotide-gated ion channel 20, chloroplastic n=1 Tax=Rutidosis leptorrhynchoides TaxID=125765 RepID=UPI003A998A35
MANYDKDEIPMLLEMQNQRSDQNYDDQRRTFSNRTRSASLSIPSNSSDLYEPNQPPLVGHTGPLRNERRTPFVQMSGPIYVPRKPESIPAVLKTLESKTERFPSFVGREENEWPEDNYAGKNNHLFRSGQLGMCNDPYCTTCPSYYNFKPAQQKNSRTSMIFDSKFLYSDAKSWTRRLLFCLQKFIPPVVNPHNKHIQKWNKFFAISCLLAIFIDPLFFFLLSVSEKHKCIKISWPWTKAIVCLRSTADFIYVLNMLLQFRLAYVAPDSRVVAGELVDHPKKIARNYLCSFFPIDLFIVLPLPQIMILVVLPKFLGQSGANYAKNLLRVSVLIQYVPRLYRFLPLLVGQSPTGFIFESAWANFVINLFTFMLSGHVVGSCWYLFGLQRVNQCFRNACKDSKIPHCSDFIDCGHGNTDKFNSSVSWPEWTNNANASLCFTDHGSINYGIYQLAVNLTAKSDMVTRYVYSLFWGFQQISTLAGNQVPSYFIWEVLFTMAIIGLGLLLFALLIGNMQNFLQALGRRRLEMSLRRRDVEQWMSHRRLPEELRRRVRESERYNWAATRGVNEDILFDNLPEDLQKDIRRHLFNFVKKVQIFVVMEDPVLDAICERLKQRTYIKGSIVLYHGGPIERIIFIVRGKMESIGEDGNRVPLSEGGVCGEELFASCLEHSGVNKDGKKIRNIGQRVFSNRSVRCLTNVEAFSLQAKDLEEVTSMFLRFFRSPRAQGAIRYESPYWRLLAAKRIQVAWRYRKKRLSRAETSQSKHSPKSEYS